MLAWSRCRLSCAIRAHRCRPEYRILLLPPRDTRLELLDCPEAARAELPANLRDIRRLNRLTGGTGLAVRTIMPLITGPRADILDVATGSADIPLAVVQAGRRRNLSPAVTGLDINPDILIAAELVAGSMVKLVRGDARNLPFADGSFDVVTLCLALHHFDPHDAVRVLGEMWRVARAGIVVVDLRRTAPAYAGVWLLTRTIARNRLTQHDGPLSVLRAYTVPEVGRLARDAGIEAPDVRPRGPARLTLVARKDRHGG